MKLAAAAILTPLLLGTAPLQNSTPVRLALNRVFECESTPTQVRTVLGMTKGSRVAVKTAAGYTYRDAQLDASASAPMASPSPRPEAGR